MDAIVAENEAAAAVSPPARRESGGHFVADGDGRASPACLVILAKSSRPGRVKTRLIGDLTAAEAAALHSAFVDDMVEEMLGGRFALRVAWALGAGEPVPATGKVRSMTQSGKDLGQRLYGALAELAREFSCVAAVGSDHPNLKVSIVDRAFDKLAAGAQVVLGPAGDGGYYLVAVRREALHREMFDEIPWSSDRVWQTTLDRCQRLGLKVDQLPIVPDVDTAEDLARLIASLEHDPRMKCSQTRALLRSWKRLTGADADARGEDHEDP